VLGRIFLVELENYLPKIDLCCLSFICAAESVQVLPVLELALEDFNSLDLVKSTSTAAISYQSDSQKFLTMETCDRYTDQLVEETSAVDPSILSAPVHPVSPSPCRENVLEQLTSETVFQPLQKRSHLLDPNSSVSKMSLDYSVVQDYQENQNLHILEESSEHLPSAGMMLNGFVYRQDTLPRPSLEKDCYWLESPGALSASGNGRPPGQSRLESQLRSLSVLQKGECLNPTLLEDFYNLLTGWTDPSELSVATVLIEQDVQPSEMHSTPASLKSPLDESCISTPSSDDAIQELPGDSLILKAISLWQPWASLISLGLKYYETRNWKTNYRGKLLICSTAMNSKQHKEYLKICGQLQLPPWDEINFPHSCAIALCDLVDCIPMTNEFIAQQSQTEILCGDWQVGRYAWKLENIQPVINQIPVKGKQGLFNISFNQKLNHENPNPVPPSNNESNKETTPSDWIQPGAIAFIEGINDNWEAKQVEVITAPEYREYYKCYNPYALVRRVDDLEMIHVRWEYLRLSQLTVVELLPEQASASLPMGIENNPKPSPSKKRAAGEGNGYIHWRTITKNGKDYPQAYYHWKENGKKKTKYIPKQLLEPIQQAEVEKRPVIEILRLLGVVSEADSQTLLGCIEGSPSNDEELDIHPSKTSPSNDEELDIHPSKTSPSNDEEHLTIPTSKSSPSKMRRVKGTGTGSIQWKTITIGAKDYSQPWYHYEFWSSGDRILKKSKYIPKRLLAQVQQLETDKATVREILKVLGVVD